MNIVDLTHPIENNMPKFFADWHVSAKLETLGKISEVGRKTSVISFGSHTGTHMDAASHFIEGGQTINQIPLEKLIGTVKIIDFSHLPFRHCIVANDLNGIEFSPRMIFCFNWARFWKTNQFYKDYPYWSKAAAQVLIDNGVNVMGMDTPSPDNSSTPMHSIDDSQIHKMLLGAGVTLIEYLANLDTVDKNKVWTLCALPLPFEEGDGSPVRACLFSNKE